MLSLHSLVCVFFFTSLILFSICNTKISLVLSGLLDAIFLSLVIGDSCEIFFSFMTFQPRLSDIKSENLEFWIKVQNHAEDTKLIASRYQPFSETKNFYTFTMKN